tara:strand:- start:18955 stop:19590 length:636 start_codon:yes stop_codon:yes gene_type:complete
MDALESLKIKAPYHAYFIEDNDNIFAQLPGVLQEVHADAELYVRELDSLGIDDSRELIQLANMRSVGIQIFVYKIRTFSSEAQNALLKLFEEPPERTHFFLCVSTLGDILPTLLSRSQVLVASSGEVENEGAVFLAAQPKKRMHILDKIIKDKNIAAADALLQDIETVVYQKGERDASITHLFAVRRVLHNKGASLKTLLESVALTLPRVR